MGDVFFKKKGEKEDKNANRRTQDLNRSLFTFSQKTQITLMPKPGISIMTGPGRSNANADKGFFIPVNNHV